MANVRSYEPAHICGAEAKSSKRPCRRPAGWGTDHVGQGRCKLHGGVSGTLKHGLYSKVKWNTLGDKIQKLKGAESLDLGEELVLARALLLDYLDRAGDGPELDSIKSLIDLIVKTVGQSHRIRQLGGISKMVYGRVLEEMAKVVVEHVRICPNCGHDATIETLRRIEAGWGIIAVDAFDPVASGRTRPRRSA